MTELQYGNARCSQNHPLWLISEGYAYCAGDLAPTFYAWRLTNPLANVSEWFPSMLTDGTPAWVSDGKTYLFSKQEVLDFIQKDMDIHREWMADHMKMLEAAR